MRAVLLLGAAMLGCAGAARAEVYDFRYVLPDTGNVVTGALGGQLEANGNTFDISNVLSLSVNGNPVASTPGVSSTDAYIFGANKAPTAALDKSVVDFTLSPGTGTALVIGVGDHLAMVYGVGVVEATPAYGGSGYLRAFNAAAYSATVVPEPASLAVVGAGVMALAAAQRRRTKRTDPART